MSPLASNRGLRLVHPLAGITRPSLHDLVARADAEAALVLLRAGRLAAWRQRVGARAVALHEALFAPPWSGPTPSWSLPFPVVTPADLARALLADHADLVRGSVLAIEPAHPEAFTTAAARWRHALDEVEESESTSATAPLVRSLEHGSRAAEVTSSWRG